MRMFQEEALVYIWPYKGISHPGHASMRICSTNEAAYISWWPGGGGKSGPFHIRPANPHLNYKQDKKAEMGDGTRQLLETHPERMDVNRFQKSRPDPKETTHTDFMTAANIKINLPGFFTRVNRSRKSDSAMDNFENVGYETQLQNGAYPLWGMGLNSMAYWWYYFNNEEKHGYRFVSKEYNCSGVVTECLKEGFAEAYVDVENPTMYRTPNDVQKLVLELARKIDFLNVHSYRLINHPRAGTTLTQTELWTYDQFYKASYVGKLARRKEQVARIDTYLRQYHEAGPWTSNKEIFRTKFKCMARMMDNVIDHGLKKPNSDRGKAVETLGNQILAVLNSSAFVDAQTGLTAALSTNLDVLLNICKGGKNPIAETVKKEKKIR